MRLKLISCDIFEPELTAAAQRSHNRIDLEFLPRAPHHLDHPAMVQCLQSRIDRAARDNYHAVLLVTGGCKHQLTGLQARAVPLVLPRAKDCISLVLERAAPASSARSPRQVNLGSSRKPSPNTGPRVREETFWMAPVYDHPTDSAPNNFPGRDSFSWRARFAAGGRAGHPRVKPRSAGRSWSLLEMLVEGYWNYMDFLVVLPGWRVVVTNSEGTIAAEEVQ